MLPADALEPAVRLRLAPLFCRSTPGVPAEVARRSLSGRLLGGQTARMGHPSSVLRRDLCPPGRCGGLSRLAPPRGSLALSRVSNAEKSSGAAPRRPCRRRVSAHVSRIGDEEDWLAVHPNTLWCRLPSRNGSRVS